MKFCHPATFCYGSAVRRGEKIEDEDEGDDADD